MIPLDKFLKATFNASGEARIIALPDRARDVWKVSRYQCHTDSTTATRLTVYKGTELQGSRVDFTKRGNDDISENFHTFDVRFGQPLVFVWTGGTSGKTAEISIYGEVVRE